VSSRPDEIQKTLSQRKKKGFLSRDTNCASVIRLLLGAKQENI
jgi:hypothetical protein